MYITYPEYFTQEGKNILLSACEEAQLYKTTAVSEVTATVSHYAHYHYQEMSVVNLPRKVVFIDIGNAKSTISIAEFSKNDD